MSGAKSAVNGRRDSIASRDKRRRERRGRGEGRGIMNQLEGKLVKSDEEKTQLDFNQVRPFYAANW